MRQRSTPKLSRSRSDHWNSPSHGIRSELARLSQKTPEPTEAATLRDTLDGLQSEEKRLVREIGGQLAAVNREDPWVDIGEIRKSMPPGSVLVDIVRFHFNTSTPKGEVEKWRPPLYAAWVVPPDGRGDVTIVDLGEAEAIDGAVKAYREVIDGVQKTGFKRGQAAAEEELKFTAAPLTAKVLQPIADAVGDATDIILSPDASLWLVPWQVPDAETAQIMQSFDASLAQGQPASQALREARLAFIKARRDDRTDEAAHPYPWAACGVTGR